MNKIKNRTGKGDTAAGRLALLIRLLYRQQCSISYLNEKTGICRTSLRAYLTELHKRGCVYISKRGRAGRLGNTENLWHLGREDDAPPLPFMTKAQINARYEARKKAGEV